jgi:acetylornithine deacetylase
MDAEPCSSSACGTLRLGRASGSATSWPTGSSRLRRATLSSSNGHVDVVGRRPKALADAPFARVRDGDWLYGRGGRTRRLGLAAIVGAVGLRRSARPLAPVQLQSVVEEECGGNGALQCALVGLQADAVVIPEPYPAFIPTSQVGVLWFHVDIAGTPAHVAEAQDGFNAIEAGYAVVRELHVLEDELNASRRAVRCHPAPINFNAGVVSGDWPSTVAAECTLSRIATYPGVSTTSSSRRDAVAARASARIWTSTAWCATRVRFEGTSVADTSRSCSRSRRLEAATGRRCHVAQRRRPTCAPSSDRGPSRASPHAERIHGIDERVLVPSVVQTAQVLALLVRDWCGLA